MRQPSRFGRTAADAGRSFRDIRACPPAHAGALGLWKALRRNCASASGNEDSVGSMRTIAGDAPRTALGGEARAWTASAACPNGVFEAPQPSTASTRAVDLVDAGDGSRAR